MTLTEVRKLKVPLLLYSFLAFVLSLWLLKFNYHIGDDGAYYARVGAHIYSGYGISANPGQPYLIHPPFYPFLVGLLNLLLRDLEFSAHLISILAFSLTVIPLFVLSREIYPSPAAHWVSLLYLTHGFLLIHSNLAMTETLFTLLVMTQLFLVHRLIQGGQAWIRLSFLIGIVSGLAFLTRPEGLLFHAAGTLSILLLSQKPFGFKSRFVLLSLAVFLLFFLPQILFIYRNSHQWQLSRGITEILIKRSSAIQDAAKYLEAKKIYEGLTDDKMRLKMDEFVEGFRLLDYLRKDPFLLLRSAVGSVMTRTFELNQYLFGGLGFFLIGASWFSASWNPSRKRSEFLLLLFLSTCLAKSLAVPLRQYFYHYFLFFIIWMGNGIEVLRNWTKQSFGLSRRRSFAAAFAACLLLALPSVGYLHRVLTQFPVSFEYKELGLWMKKNIPNIEKETVASRQPAVSFYSGAKILKLPYVEKFEDLLTFLDHQQAKYFVVSEGLDPPFLDAYRFLLNETANPPPGVERIHTVKVGHKAILYQRVS